MLKLPNFQILNYPSILTVLFKLSDFKQFKTKTYVYWRFNMIIRKGNAMVRSFKKKKNFK